VQEVLGTDEHDPGSMRNSPASQLEAVSSGQDEVEKRLRLKAIDRKGIFLCPVDVENLIDEEHSARAIWEFVGQLDLGMFRGEIRVFEGEAGRSAFDPHLLISLWIYAYTQGVGKARAISRLCDHDPAFQWLTGMQPVSYHTLSDFRISHKEKLDDLFKQILAILDSENIVDLKRVFHDGSKIAADASASSFHRLDKVEANLQLAKQVIAELEKEDPQQQSLRLQSAKRRAAKQREESLQKALEEFKKLPPTTTRKHETRVSQTDPEARNMKQAGGRYGPAYNAQISTEGKNGFVVAAHISQSSSDFGQLVPAVENIIDKTGTKPEEVVVDSGFASKKNIVQMSQQGIQLIGPLLPQSSTVEQLEKRGIDPDFGKEAFCFNSENNHYICPTGKILSHVCTRNGKASIEHLYRASAIDCRNCPLKEKCCGKTKRFQRTLIRTEDLPEITSFKETMKTQAAKEIYKQRSRFAEFPFAWIKEKFGLRKFHLRGQDKSLVELIWVCLAFNITGFIRIKRALLA